MSSSFAASSSEDNSRSGPIPGTRSRKIEINSPVTGDGLSGALSSTARAAATNSPDYAKLASDLGITVISRSTLEQIGITEACLIALRIAGADGPVHVDLDVDVCDRSVVPACPAAAPGGISAYEIRQAARLLAADPRVRGIDITEIDAAKDSEDGRTVRLGALLVLESLSGYILRR